MLRKDKPIYIAILFINLPCIAVGVLLSIMDMVSNAYDSAFLAVCEVFNIITLLFGAFYILSGFSKKSSKYYKIFGGLFSISKVMVILFFASVINNSFAAVFEALALSIILIFISSLNLGKGMSFALCGVLVALSVAVFIVLAAKGGNTSDYLISAVSFILSCTYAAMTAAKYIDKSERGTN